MDDFRYLPTESVWVGSSALGVNQSGEVIVEAPSGDGPRPVLIQQAEDAILSESSQPVSESGGG